MWHHSSVHLRIHRTDGKTGSYSQDDPRRAAVLAKRFDPDTLFNSGPIVVGVHNPFTILNADEVCWVEVRTSLALGRNALTGIEQLQRLPDRDAYEALLARQWPRWRSHASGKPGDLMEALIEVTFRGGDAQYLHAIGVATNVPLPQLVFGPSAVAASFEPDGMLYINPRTVVRARVYHSRSEVQYPNGLWFAEADDI